MKKVLLVAALMTAGFGVHTYAQTEGAAPVAQQPTKAPEKQEIKVADLPAPIQQTLASDAFKGAEVVSAYLIKGEKNTYEITLKKDGQQATVKFDEQGNIIQ